MNELRIRLGCVRFFYYCCWSARHINKRKHLAQTQASSSKSDHVCLLCSNSFFSIPSFSDASAKGRARCSVCVDLFYLSRTKTTKLHSVSLVQRGPSSLTRARTPCELLFASRRKRQLIPSNLFLEFIRRKSLSIIVTETLLLLLNRSLTCAITANFLLRKLRVEHKSHIL